MARSKKVPTPLRKENTTSREQNSQDDQNNNSFGSVAKQAVPSRNSTVKKKTPVSKRKSVPPAKRKSVTEVLRSHYGVNRFGRIESCPQRTFRELRHFQRTTHLLIPKLPFARLVREIMSRHLKDLRIQTLALEAIQEAAEIHIVDIFGACNLVAAHCKRKTVNNKDMALVNFLQKWNSGGGQTNFVV